MKNFETTLDKYTLKVTYIVILVVSVLIVLSIIFAILEILTTRYTIALIIVTGILSVSVTVAYLFKPDGYVLLDNELLIKRKINIKHIPFDKIDEIKLLNKEETKSLFRIVGIGGVFGWVGKFWNKKLGFLNLYASKAYDLVLIKTSDSKKILISPEEKERFVNEINKLLRQFSIN